MSEPEMIMIDTDIMKSTIYTMGAFIIVLFGAIWKLVLVIFSRFERSIIKEITGCHNGLDEYAKDTRNKVDKIDRWTADHIEKHHT